MNVEAKRKELPNDYLSQIKMAYLKEAPPATMPTGQFPPDFFKPLLLFLEKRFQLAEI